LPVIEGYLAAGDVRRASELLDKMLAFIAETASASSSPRSTGDGRMLLAGAAARGRRTDAIACFERAIALAEAQEGPALRRLRAATSLYGCGRRRPGSG
jgi:hypothetical protein